LTFRQAEDCILQGIYKMLHLSFVRWCILKLYDNIVQVSSSSGLRKLDTNSFQKWKESQMTILNMLSSYLLCRSHYNYGFTLSIGETRSVHFTCFCFSRHIRLKSRDKRLMERLSTLPTNKHYLAKQARKKSKTKLPSE
jgi:hypothetical protein